MGFTREQGAISIAPGAGEMSSRALMVRIGIPLAACGGSMRSSGQMEEQEQVAFP